jgi:membrane protein
LPGVTSAQHVGLYPALVLDAAKERAPAVASQLRERVREHNLTLVAAGVAFYAFLALVPALIAFVSIYGLVADEDDVARQVEDLGSSLPEEVSDFLVYQLTQIANASSAGVSIAALVAVALALWSASSGMAALVTGIHIARERDEPKGFVAKRGKALGLTVGAIVVLGIVLFVIVGVPPLIRDAGLGSVGRVAFEVLRWPFLAAVMVVGIALLYRFAVAESTGGWLGFVSPGALVATAGWVVASGLFAVYTANFASYGKTYGALASIVVVLLWLWLSSLVVLVGAEVDGVRKADGS